jgi:hypothetical protein
MQLPVRTPRLFGSLGGAVAPNSTASRTQRIIRRRSNTVCGATVKDGVDAAFLLASPFSQESGLAPKAVYRNASPAHLYEMVSARGKGVPVIAAHRFAPVLDLSMLWSSRVLPAESNAMSRVTCNNLPNTFARMLPCHATQLQALKHEPGTQVTASGAIATLSGEPSARELQGHLRLGFWWVLSLSPSMLTRYRQVCRRLRISLRCVPYMRIGAQTAAPLHVQEDLTTHLECERSCTHSHSFCCDHWPSYLPVCSIC